MIFELRFGRRGMRFIYVGQGGIDVPVSHVVTSTAAREKGSQDREGTVREIQSLQGHFRGIECQF